MVNENERSTSIDEMVLVYSKYAISQSDSGPILAQTSDDFAGVISFIKYKVLFNIFVNKNASISKSINIWRERKKLMNTILSISTTY